MVKTVKNKLTGGMIISKKLKELGINTTFALAGASHTYLLDALDNDGFKVILSRHETATIGAADGYSRISRMPGVALIVSDQGFWINTFLSTHLKDLFW